MKWHEPYIRRLKAVAMSICTKWKMEGSLPSVTSILGFDRSFNTSVLIEQLELVSLTRLALT